MALVFPDTAENYKAFFEELAKTHKSIRHLEDPGRDNFCLVSVGTSVPGLSSDDVRAYLKKINGGRALMKASEENCQMVLIQMDTEATSEQFKMNMHSTFASFLILTRPKRESIADRDEAAAACYRVGRELLSAIKHFFNTNALKGRITKMDEESARIDSYVGWRFDLEYDVYGSLCYNADNFTNLTITEL